MKKKLFFVFLTIGIIPSLYSGMLRTKIRILEDKITILAKTDEKAWVQLNKLDKAISCLEVEALNTKLYGKGKYHSKHKSNSKKKYKKYYKSKQY